jgi:glycosyltransferase involved in cell wall biosynthesis
VSRAIAFVLKGYPRLSETFIANEIRALEERGLDIRIVSLRKPTDASIHPVHDEIAASVHYLPEYLHHEPGRVLRAWRRVRRWPTYAACLSTWLRDFRRDRSANRVRRFGQAVVLAHEMPADVAHLHAHFLHTPASVARYASLLLGLPWSCSAHAKDIWTTPDWEKREKLAACRWAVTCTATNQRHLQALAPEEGRVELVYHGLDANRFPAPAEERPARDGSDDGEPVRLLSVGRAVEKKGHQDLLRALALLPPQLQWRFEHVGDGPWLERLRRLATDLGLANRVRWHGALAQAGVRERYAGADLFVLASRVAGDGDRDGLPNVLLEAQSQGLACVSTRVSAIPELLVDGSTGILVEQGDTAALARALAGLIGDPPLRERLGEAGRQRVRERFRFEDGVLRLEQKLAPSQASV